MLLWLRLSLKNFEAEEQRMENVINYDATKSEEEYFMVKGTRGSYFLPNSFIQFYLSQQEGGRKSAYHCDYLNLLWK